VRLGSWPRATARALLTPWRPLADTLPPRQALIVAASHVLAAALLSTLLSNWIYLAVKGVVKGADEMDLGADDLPPDSIVQVAVGLGGSVLIWSAVLALVVLVALTVARELYEADAGGFRRASAQALTSSAWMLPWALAWLLALTVRPPGLVMPGRWPLGETMDVRQRLPSLLALYALAWAPGLPPRARRVESGLWRTTLALGLFALAWLALFRLTPWLSIEAFCG
jgi:hypothetical protein